jgi:hypothetical protein
MYLLSIAELVIFVGVARESVVLNYWESNEKVSGGG